MGGQTQWAGCLFIRAETRPLARPLHPAPQPGCVGVSDHWWWIARRPNRSNSLRPRHFDYKSREREHALPLYSIVYFILLIILRVILHPSVEVGLKEIGSRDFRGLKMILMETA